MFNLNRNRFGVSIFAVLLLAVSACTATNTQRTAGQTVDDSVLLGRVKAALVRDDTTKARDINVDVYRGVVQLNGFVDSNGEKMEASKVAKGVEGVRQVRNNLEVRSGDRTAGAVLDDGVITAKVKSALIADSRTKAREINVTTNEGVVQLSGFVDSSTARSAAAEVAGSISGVKSVRNELEVKN